MKTATRSYQADKAHNVAMENKGADQLDHGDDQGQEKMLTTNTKGKYSVEPFQLTEEPNRLKLDKTVPKHYCTNSGNCLICLVS